MDREKHLLLLPYTPTHSSYIVSFLLHQQYCEICEPMIFKMWVKDKFVLWQPCYCNLLTWKKEWEKLCFWSTHYFKNILLLTIARNPLRTPTSDDILSEILHAQIQLFYLIKWKRGFGFFLIDHYARDIAIALCVMFYFHYSKNT